MTRHNLTFLTKSGGHSYSLDRSVVDNGIMINMQNFNTSKVNDDFTVTVGSGANFGSLVQIVGSAGREMSGFGISSLPSITC
jgi:fumiquinazoline A oxidase